jgi:acetyl esterase
VQRQPAAVVSIASDSGDLPIAFQLLDRIPATDQHPTAPRTPKMVRLLLTSETMEYFTGRRRFRNQQYRDWRVSSLLHSDLSRC